MKEKAYVDKYLKRLTDRMTIIRGKKGTEIEQLGILFVTNDHLSKNYPGSKEAKMWIDENEKMIGELRGK